MSRPTAHRRDERGALSSGAAMAAALVVLAALAYYVLTGGPGGSSSTGGAGTASSSATGTPTSSPPVTPSVTPSLPTSTSPAPTDSSSTEPATPTSEPTQTIVRSDYRVGVYNNSAISGLASATATTVKKLGWNVVAVSNWSGQIPSTTVYYPSGYRAAAQLLAADLGVKRIHVATRAMSSRALTLILTGPLG